MVLGEPRVAGIGRQGDQVLGSDGFQPVKDPEAMSYADAVDPCAIGVASQTAADTSHGSRRCVRRRALRDGGCPDGMAASVLVGVSPVHGLYASMAGPIAGGLTTSTELMLVTTTSAAALAAGSALSGISAADRPGALTALTLLASLLMIIAALLRAGRYTRFVSHSVMTGFLTGVAADIVLGQIPESSRRPQRRVRRTWPKQSMPSSTRGRLSLRRY